MNYIVKAKYGVHIIHIESLLAVEVNDYLSTFYVDNGASVTCIESLQKILSKLPDYFIRISRSCLINTQHVKSIDYKRREVELSGNRIHGFSVRNAKVLKQMIKPNL